MSNKKTQQAATGYWETVRDPKTYLYDVWYIKGKHKERIAADIPHKECLEAMLDDAKHRGMM